jgi:hypothetical protein
MPTVQSEAFSRVLIDKALEYSGWDLLDPNQIRFEYHNVSGRADYLLKDSLGRLHARVGRLVWSSGIAEVTQKNHSEAQNLHSHHPNRLPRLKGVIKRTSQKSHRNFEKYFGSNRVRKFLTPKIWVKNGRKIGYRTNRVTH